MPNEDLVKAIRRSRYGQHDLSAHQECELIARSIEHDFVVTPRRERLLAVGGPKHGEQIEVEAGRDHVRVPARVGDTLASRLAASYQRIMLATGAGERTPVLVYQG